MIPHKSYITAWLTAVIVVGSLGCGTNLDQLLQQSLAASGRTILDVLITEAANLATGLTGDVAPANNTNETPNNSDEGGTIDELTGDANRGETIFSNDSCSSCHCADATGGCAANAPRIAGVDTSTLDDRIRGDAPHPGGKRDFSNQDIVDLQAFLDSL